MALRKFLFMNGSEGFAQEQSATDDIQLGKVALSGIGGVAVDAGNQLISNVATPVSGSDAVNKTYVDSLATGLLVKAPVKAVAVAEVTLSGTQTIDGVALSAGARVLVTAQSTAAANGIYVVADGAWSRAADANDATEMRQGMICFVEEGTDYADSQWVLTTNSYVFGVSDATFVRFSSLGQIQAGSGLTKTLNELNVGAGNGIAVSSDAVAVDLATDAGLQFTSGKLDAKPDNARALAKDGSGLYVKIDTGKSLAMDASNGIQVKADAAKALAIDATNGLQVVADSNYGLSIDGTTGLRVDLAANKGLAMESGDIAIDLATDPALQFTSGKLDFKPDTARALAKDASGAYVKIDTAKSLAMDATNGIQVKADAAKALAIDGTNGLQVVADSNYGLSIDGTTGLRVDLAANKGLAMESGDIAIDLATDPGLQFTSGKLDAKPDNARAMAKDASGLYVKIDTAKSLAMDATNGIQVKADAAKALAIDGTNGLQVVVDGAKAMAIDATNGLQVKADGAKAVAIDPTNGLQVKADTAKAVAIDATNGLQVVADSNYGLSIDGTTGLRVDLAANKGLEFASGDLAIKLESDAALEFDALNGGLELKIANADHLAKSASGVSVVGVPSLFKINGSAVSANVTHTNLNTLTAGDRSAVTTLHYHPTVAALSLTHNLFDAFRAVYAHSANTVAPGACSSGAVDEAKRIIGFTSEAPSAGTVRYVMSGVVSGMSGLTTGLPYYLGSNGAAVPFSNLVSGDRVIRLGFAINTTSMVINIQDMGQKA